MDAIELDLVALAEGRLARCYSGEVCDWSRFYRPKQEKLNLASRYHLVYPGLAYFVELRRDPTQAARLRPQLDTIYRSLLEPRCWRYWHEELGEESWPLQERNLTYAGRLATFIGFYIDAFGAAPAEVIELDGRTTTYSALSQSLWQQMSESPSCGVSCYHNQSMVMCNAHMLINNRLHDRLFGTDFAEANAGWLATLDKHLLRSETSGPLFFFGTQPDRPEPIPEKRALGADIWALFLMSAEIPQRVADWFEAWQRNVLDRGDQAFVEVAAWEAEQEFSSDDLATAWAYCLAKELGQAERARRLRRFLAPKIAAGSDLDPYLTGLFLLGEGLQAGAFGRLVNTPRGAT